MSSATAPQSCVCAEQFVHVHTGLHSCACIGVRTADNMLAMRAAYVDKMPLSACTPPCASTNICECYACTVRVPPSRTPSSAASAPCSEITMTRDATRMRSGGGDNLEAD